MKTSGIALSDLVDTLVVAAQEAALVNRDADEGFRSKEDAEASLEALSSARDALWKAVVAEVDQADHVPTEIAVFIQDGVCEGAFTSDDKSAISLTINEIDTDRGDADAYGEAFCAAQANMRKLVPYMEHFEEEGE